MIPDGILKTRLHLQMTYHELINHISEELNLSKNEIDTLIKQTVLELGNQLENGYSFSIPGLGRFSTKVIEVHKVFDSHQQKYILIPPKRIVEFTPGKDLNDRLKNIRAEDE